MGSSPAGMSGSALPLSDKMVLFSNGTLNTFVPLHALLSMKQNRYYHISPLEAFQELRDDHSGCHLVTA